MPLDVYSTIEFRSNLYPVVADELLHDESFLHSIRDPFALQEFKRRAYRYHPSAIQREILDKGVGIPCKYADSGDLAWGSVRDGNVEKVICLCEQYSCDLFPSCRPGVSRPIEELPPEEAIASDESEATTSGLGVSLEFAEERDFPESREEEPVGDNSRYETGAEESADLLIDDRDWLYEEPDEAPVSAVQDDFEGELAKGDEPIIPVAGAQVASVLLGKHEGVDGRYDEHQAVIVHAEPSRRIYVNAGPGAGKTHTLIEKLKCLMEDQRVEPDRITVLSFTRAAVSVVQNRLKSAAERRQIHSLWQDVDVTTFDKLCTRLLYYVAGENDDEAEKKRIARLDYNQRIVRAKNLISEHPELLAGCDHLIVDETQDLVGDRADLVLAILGALPRECGFTLFGDRCQSVYEYQVKDGGTTSGEFFSAVCQRYSPEQIYLEKNYRQKPSYPLDLSALREALLNDDAETASELISEAAAKLGEPTEPIRSIDTDLLQEELRHGKMGILTRKNDEALEIESMLWKLGIPSFQTRSDAGSKPSRCIADAFIGCKGETIAKEEFEALTADSDPYGDGRMWRALLSLDNVRPAGDRLRVSSVLSALNGAVLPPELLAERTDLHGITVSTVHASKGREFDTVWMLAENLFDFGKAASMEEKRVAYVGLTRGAGSLSLQCLDEHYLVGGRSKFSTYKMFNRDRFFRKRSGRKGLTGKSRVVNIEIRNEIDIDEASFRDSKRLQEELASGNLEGEQVRFVLRGGDDDARYDIVLQDDESFILGRLTRTFIDDYRACSSNAPLPDAFDQVYIDRITTCVGRSMSEPSCDRPFDDMAVWYGFTIGGYAHRDDSQGY